MALPVVNSAQEGLAVELRRLESPKPLHLRGRAEQTVLLYTMASSLSGAMHRLDGTHPRWFDCLPAGVRLIPAGSTYELQVRAFKRFHYLAVAIHPKVLEAAAGNKGDVWDQAPWDGHPVPVLSSLLESLAGELGGNVPLGDLARGHYAALLARALRNQTAVAQTVITQDVGAYVDRHFAEKLDVAQLARLFGTSRWALARAFRRQHGVSPQQYLQQRRLDEACRLLRCTSLTVAEVAQAVGLGSQSHFGAVFKRYLGITPTAYRRGA